MRVPAYDIARANAPFRTGLSQASDAVLNSAHLILGNFGVRFEQQFAEYCGTEQCVGVGNGLDALALALAALRVGPGDEVIVPAFTFIATWFSVLRVGARPIPVDVLTDGLINVDLVESVITSRTKAIVPVHLFGRMADMDRLGAISESYKVPIVEDAAQAHGAVHRQKRAGSFGRAAAFSFYPTKNLGALGDGGAVCTNDPDLALTVRRLRNYGSDVKYRHEIIGQNSRLDELQAAFLSVKLPSLETSNDRRRATAELYASAFHERDLGNIKLPPVSGSPVWHQYVIRTEHRDALMDGLARQGVGTTIHYPVAPFDQPCFSGQYERSKYPIAIGLSDSVLSLPMGDYLRVEEVHFVVNAVASYCNGIRRAA